MPDPLFRFSTTLEVTWRDLDALGHVNNAVYFSYLEYARMKYLQELGLAFQSLQDVGIILAEAACTYVDNGTFLIIKGNRPAGRVSGAREKLRFFQPAPSGTSSVEQMLHHQFLGPLRCQLR